MNDYIVRGMTMDGFVKVVAIRSTNMVAEAARIHNTTANATAALGRCLTAASMMGNMQKVENGSMTMQVRGGGPIGGITCVSDAVGNVRGYVLEPHVPLMEKYPGKLDIGATVGTDGTMTIIRDLQGYVDGIREGGQVLREVQEVPERERAGEYVMLRMRTTNGIKPEEYEHMFLLPFAPLEDILDKHRKLGYANRTEDGRWQLTPKGFLISNSSISDLLIAQDQSQPLKRL